MISYDYYQYHMRIVLLDRYPGWNCLNILHLFVDYQGIFHVFIKLSKKRPRIAISLNRFNFTAIQKLVKLLTNVRHGLYSPYIVNLCQCGLL